MNNSLICEVCGTQLNKKHIKYNLYLQQNISPKTIIDKILHVTDGCCVRQIRSKKMNQNVRMFIIENNEKAMTKFNIKYH